MNVPFRISGTLAFLCTCGLHTYLYKEHEIIKIYGLLENPSKWPIMYSTVKAIYINLREKIQEIREFLLYTEKGEGADTDSIAQRPKNKEDIEAHA